MNILFVGDHSNDPRLGSAKVPAKLREEFEAQGHRCRIVSAADLGPRPRGRHLRALLSPVLALRAVRRAIREWGAVDVIDAASAEGLYPAILGRLGRGLASAVVARSNGLEHLNYRRMVEDHRHGLLHKPAWKRVWHPLVRLTQVEWAVRAADRVILLNPADREFVLRRGWKRAEEIDLIGHGVSAGFIADVPPPDNPRGAGVLYCGTWTGMKGVEYLARAFGLLAGRGVAADLTILGGAAPEPAIRAAFPPAARPRLRILDRLPESEVVREYRRHDLLVFPSTYEGFGMVLLEAMSQRLPVVATPVGAASTLVRDGETGLLVPPRDPHRLADAIARLVSDPGLRRRLAENAFRLVRDQTWGRTAEETLAAYERAIAHRRVRAAGRHGGSGP